MTRITLNQPWLTTSLIHIAKLIRGTGDLTHDHTKTPDPHFRCTAILEDKQNHVSREQLSLLLLCWSRHQQVNPLNVQLVPFLLDPTVSL